MAIIRPSLVFEGSHFGDRYDPEPGDYTARLLSVQFTNERKSHIRMSEVGAALIHSLQSRIGPFGISGLQPAL
jgi:hypothetical protein